jgi:Skp family chaperone for outer membrane proteins
LQFAAAAGLIGGLCLLATAGRQSTAAGAAPRQATARVAFVDLGHILRNYKKLEDLQEPVREFMSQAEAKHKAILEKARKLHEELKSGEFEAGSSEIIDRESALIQLSGRDEALKATTKREKARKDAVVLREVYLEIQDVVRQFAEVNGYTLVLQYDRDALASNDPNFLQQKLAGSVVLNQGGDDITDAALEYLSSAYAKEAGKGDSAAPPKTSPSTKTAPRKAAAAPAQGAKATTR